MQMFNFEIRKEVAVLVRYTGNDKCVIIPSVFNGVEVGAIGAEAFARSSVEEVFVPDTVTVIEDRAFSYSKLRWIGCGSSVEDRENEISFLLVSRIGKFAFAHTELKDLQFQPKDGTLTIGENAFRSCYGLNNVVFSEQIQELTLCSGCFESSSVETCLLPTKPGVMKAIPDRAFSGCEDLRDVSFATTTIGKDAFKGAIQLSSIDLSEGLRSISSGAFRDCTNIKAITLPSSCTTIIPSAFLGTSIASYAVNGENPCFRSDKGVLFSRDMSVLVAFPPQRGGESYQVPNSVKCIANSAFRNSLMYEVVLPKNLKRIEACAFRGSHLRTVELPGLEHIGEDAFSHCHLRRLTIPSHLKFDWEDCFYRATVDNVYYHGSVENYHAQITGELAGGEHTVFYFLDHGQEYKQVLDEKKSLLFSYSVFADGIRIDKIHCLFRKVTVPGIIDTHTVTELGPFSVAAGIQEIRIPESVNIHPNAIPADCRVVRY